MSYIGILHPSGIKLDLLKQHIAYFDELYIPALDLFLQAKDGTRDGDVFAKEIEYLTKLGVIKAIELNADHIDKIIASSFESNEIQKEEVVDSFFKNVFSPLNKDLEYKEIEGYPEYIARSEFSEHLSGMMHPISKSQYLSIGTDVLTRAYATKLSQEGVNATALVKSMALEDNRVSGYSDVISLMIREFPMPSKNVPFEEIFIFKKENPILRNRFRQWMKTISTKEMNYKDILEELEDIVAEYENAYKNHKVDYNQQMLKSILLMPAELIEGLIKCSPTKIVNSFFRVSEEKAKLLEKEKDLVGREIAYLVNARSKLSDS